MRVIIVDDESLIRMDMRDIIEAAGYEVVGEGRNGVEAIKLAKEVDFDIILMDIKMPELDGIEAAKQIAYADLGPVVLLTAYSQEDLIAKAMETGVYGYLVKPVRENQIIPTLKMAIARYKDAKKLTSEKNELAKDLQDRKLIAKAKGILMKIYDLSEDEAYSKIRSFSMNKGKTITEVCEAIIKSAQKRKDS